MKINSHSPDKAQIGSGKKIKKPAENVDSDVFTASLPSSKSDQDLAFLNMAKFHTEFKGLSKDALPSEEKNFFPGSLNSSRESRNFEEHLEFLETDAGFLFTPDSASAVKIKEDKDLPPKDTYLFVLNSSGETNLAKPLIASVKQKGFKVKVIHFRKNSKEILTSQGVLEEDDFIDGTNMLYLPRTGRIFDKEIDTNRVVKLFGTPHHAYCRFAFSKAKKKGIPTIAFVDMGMPGTDFKYRHTFYKTLSMADKIVLANDVMKKRLEKNKAALEEKSDLTIDMGKVSLGGNPGFEAFRMLVELNRPKVDEIRNELSIGKDDLVVSFSSQPTDNNGKVLETTGKALKKLAEANPGKKIHFLMVPHPRDSSEGRSEKSFRYGKQYLHRRKMRHCRKRSRRMPSGYCP